MLISLLVGLTSTLICAPIWLIQLYQNENSWQRNQIYIDNAAILLGRKDRELLSQVDKDSRALNRLHQMYHRALTCSLIPAVSASCATTAKNLSKLIIGLSKVAETRNGRTWITTEREVRDYLFRNQVMNHINRNPILPLKARICKTCRLVEGWSVNEPLLNAQIQSWWNGEIRVAVKAVKLADSAWSYRLWPQ